MLLEFLFSGCKIPQIWLNLPSCDPLHVTWGHMVTAKIQFHQRRWLQCIFSVSWKSDWLLDSSTSRLNDINPSQLHAPRKNHLLRCRYRTMMISSTVINPVTIFCALLRSFPRTLSVSATVSANSSTLLTCTFMKPSSMPSNSSLEVAIFSRARRTALVAVFDSLCWVCSSCWKQLALGSALLQYEVTI